MTGKYLRGGEKLRVHLDKIAKNLGTAKAVEAGYLGGTTENGVSLPMIAAIQEYGTTQAGKNHSVTIPARPFMRATVVEKQGEWPSELAKALRDNNLNAGKALAAMGEKIATQIEASARNWTDPPNAPATIKKKGFNDPLVGAGDLLDKADYRVIS